MDHGLLQLAAMQVGVPAVPVSPAYSLLAEDHAQLRHGVGKGTHRAVELAERPALDGAVFALRDQRELLRVFRARLRMPIDAIADDVRLASDKPLRVGIAA